MDYALSLTDIADEATRLAIVAPLVEYNLSQTSPGENKPIVIAIRGADGAVLGGLWGHTGFDWLFTQFLVVPEALRRRGVGSEIMRLAEQEAVRRGCHGAWLDTFEFQARGFYERIGYTCFAELADYPKGLSRFFMRKDLPP
jgi:GNAT superfamily N-acetyltransferase